MGMALADGSGRGLFAESSWAATTIVISAGQPGMICALSDFMIIWRKFCDDRAFLMVSADSDRQQIQSSQIQLRHGPQIVRAFNFAP
jgi:hypothetical protein